MKSFTSLLCLSAAVGYVHSGKKKILGIHTVNDVPLNKSYILPPAACQCPNQNYDVIRDGIDHPGVQNIIFGIMQSKYASGLDVLNGLLTNPISTDGDVFRFDDESKSCPVCSLSFIFL